jgi:hypothetical protein
MNSTSIVKYYIIDVTRTVLVGDVFQFDCAVGVVVFN